MPNAYKFRFLARSTLCRDGGQSWDPPRDRMIIYRHVREDKSRGERASPRDGNVQLAQM